jgi:Ca-activated chloride channel family protein
LLRIEHPLFLLSLVLLPVMVIFFWWVVRWKKRTAQRIGDEHLIRRLIADYSPRKYLVKFILVSIAFALTGMGLANLQSPEQVEQIQRQGVDVMIVLDVSKSMMARDIQPSRMEKARQLAFKLVDKLKNDRVGLVLFAGRAYLQMPLTTDHAAARIYIGTAGPESVPAQGTVIGEALQVSQNAFASTEKKFKTIVLITDGEDHDDRAMELARTLSEEGVLLHTIGVGTSEGATLQDPQTGEQKKDAQGNVVISRLNEPILQELSRTAGGVYQQLGNTDEVVKGILTQIEGMEKKAIVDPSSLRYRSFFQWFLALALLILTIEFLIPEKKKLKPI